MKKTQPRQVVPLKRWNSRSTKATDPDFSGRLCFDKQLLQYLMICLQNEEAPEFFLSLWVNEEEGKAALGLAVPFEWVDPRNRASREDFAEWMT